MAMNVEVPSPLAMSGPSTHWTGGFAVAVLGEGHKDYLCGLCKLILNDPVQTECGHR